jgi:hypothetical protein
VNKINGMVDGIAINHFIFSLDLTQQNWGDPYSFSILIKFQLMKSKVGSLIF